MTTYEKTVMASWGDMDFNSHMANTACLDRLKAGPVRLDLNVRKLTAPPEPLRLALEAPPRTAGFAELRPSVTR